MDDRLANALHEVDKSLSIFAMAVADLKSAMTEDLSTIVPDPIPAIAKLREDLAWRGPGGKQAGNVCLPRNMAGQLLEWIDEQQRGI